MESPKISEAIAALPPELPFFSLEFFPPKTSTGLNNLYPRLQRLRTLNPLFICITFSAGGSTAQRTLDLADVCQNQLGFRTCVHLTCTNFLRGGRTVVDDVLKKCKELGIRNILALRGDEPREGEYGILDHQNGNSDSQNANAGNGPESEEKFAHATDLIRYIRRKHGSYFCIGAAAYPEGHPVSSAAHAGGYFQDPEHDLPHLIEKVRAGADFLLTQLFYDVEKYLEFEGLLRGHEDGVLGRIPVIPGLMPVQGWGSFTRTCKLARVGVPQSMNERLVPWKADDEKVKSVGVDMISEIIERIQKETRNAKGSREVARGYHLYSLNLEKAVAQILERTKLVSMLGAAQRHNESAVVVVDGEALRPVKSSNKARRKSSVHNHVLVRNLSPSGVNAEYQVLESSAGQPRQREQSADDALATAEGEGSLGRTATWDDFPNGRWGDSRSPAYAPTNNYNLHPNLSRGPALRLWKEPRTAQDITDIFRRYLLGTLGAVPWSEEDSAVSEVSSGTVGSSTDPSSGLRPETAMIKDELLSVNAKGWWTIASQPAVNAARSGDEVVGWGPRKGGFVWQKPFVELFLPGQDWNKLKIRLDDCKDQATYFAGNAAGDFEATDEHAVNPVTWGAFKGKE